MNKETEGGKSRLWQSAVPRLMFAAPKSGGGKTTLTCAFLQAMKKQGRKTAAFKCGPDYIDPMFHSRVIGVPSGNLDLFFTGKETVRGLFCRHSQGAELAVVEGVMGYYDGLGGGSDQASSWQLADCLEAPVVLVLDPQGASLSLAALVRGFLEFRRNSRIQALILNRCSKGLYQTLKPMLERETGLLVAGYLPSMPECAFESRHLGLVTAGEIRGMRQKLEGLAAQLVQTVDLEALLHLAKTAPALEGRLPELPVCRPFACTGKGEENEKEAAPIGEQPGRTCLPAGAGPEKNRADNPAGKKAAAGLEGPCIAVARDQAFCFYYRDNLELLEQLGARLCFFSPLEDGELPPDTGALYLGGGYPELYGRRLSQNQSLLTAIRQGAKAGLPILAECGGFQYLQEQLIDAQGRAWPMAGLLPGESRPAGRLVRFGYVELQARNDTLLCPAGTALRAHEFHYWDSEENGEAFWAAKPGKDRGWLCIQSREQIFAGYPHLYFYTNPAIAAAFVEAAAAYRRKKEEERQ